MIDRVFLSHCLFFFYLRLVLLFYVSDTGLLYFPVLSFFSLVFLCPASWWMEDRLLSSRALYRTFHFVSFSLVWMAILFIGELFPQRARSVRREALQNEETQRLKKLYFRSCQFVFYYATVM